MIPAQREIDPADSNDTPDRTSRGDRDVVAQRLGDRGVLVDLRTGTIFELNATGFRIWELLASGASPASIVALLQAEFAAPASVIETDVEELIRRLTDAHLLEP